MKVLIHDVAKARKEAGPLRHPVLRYTDGTSVVLMENGQRIRVDAKVRGKDARRMRIKNKRAVREMTEKLAREGTRL